MRSLEWVEPHDLSPEVSLMLAVATVGVFLVAIAAALWVAARESTRAAQARTREATAEFDPDLAPGEVILHGTVVTEDGEPAAHLEMEQKGHHLRHKGRVYARVWKEVSRKLEVRPFHLRLADGTLVRVIAPPTLTLVDDLVPEDDAFPHRKAHARLSHGESAFVEGVLRGSSGSSGAYRAGDGWTLEGDAMLVSTHPLTAPHAARRRRALHVAGVFAAGLAVVVGVLTYTGFGPLSVSGSCVEASILAAEHWTTAGRRGRRIHHHGLRGAIVAACDGSPTPLEGEEMRVETSVEAAGWFETGGRAPFVVTPGLWFRQVGDQPTLNFMLATFGLMGLLGFIGWGVHDRVRRTTPWYDQRKVWLREEIR